MTLSRSGHHLDPPEPRHRKFAGADQPARLSFEFDRILCDGKRVAVRTDDVAQLPFCALVRFAREDGDHLPKVLVVAPLSCHFSVLERDLVLGLLPDFQVYMTDWINARYVPAHLGPFGLEDDILYIAQFMKMLAPDLNVVALCQGGMPALAATAYVSELPGIRAPRRLALIGASIDILVNQTRVSRMIRARPLSWYAKNVIMKVPAGYAGAGRHVYPGTLQIMGLWTYLLRHVSEGGELLHKLVADDGADPECFPFIDLYTSVMDIPAELFVDVMRHVYHERTLARGTFPLRDGTIHLSAIETPLMTVEGEQDDIAAPGQTSAAHDLCVSVPNERKRALMVAGSGHFSLFHGATWRDIVRPQLERFLA